MTDHPILFSGPMVQAILREIEAPGTGKTQTRRVIKLPRKTASGGQIYERKDMGGWEPTTNGGAGCFIVARDGTRRPAPETVGLWHRTTGVCLNTDKQAGDLLWVRETWAHYQAVDYVKRPDGRAFSEISDGLAGYKADGYDSIEDFRNHVRLLSGVACEAVEINGNRWRPSIHMPRWASRLTLEVTGVKVERLQDISEEDAASEGVENDTDGWFDCQMPATQRCTSARGAFQALWDAINGPGAWDRNPWVCAITFRPHLCNIDAFLKENAE